MENILSIEGNVKFTITLDPGVWIFDDRKVDLNNYFISNTEKEDELAAYTKNISAHWDREIREGAVFPPTLKTERKFEKEKIINGSFGIAFKHFLQNAEPGENASVCLIETEDKTIEVPLEEAEMIILAFSHNGKPLKEDGPVHIYFGDGSNQNEPLKRVRKFIIK
ncbi:MAG TPA: peptidyl-prolyl cis-trans isomerase [Bacillus sp. (in: firmicutes)]|nr:peptidyl-prolyl cis-trans isomerase [Bacillus sp. (in: firmicutes)]